MRSPDGLCTSLKLRVVEELASELGMPRRCDRELDSRISQHFGKSPYFILIDVHKDGPRSWFVVENPGARIERKRGIEAAHLLAQHRADILVAKEVGEGPYHVLRDSSIQIFDLDEESNIERVVDAFLRKELRSLAHQKESG